MKILWNSNAPWAHSGYGVQTALFCPRFRDAGHDVAISCFFGLQGGILQYDGITCYPNDGLDFGKRMLPNYAKKHGDGRIEDVLVIGLQDVWTLTDVRFGGVMDTTDMHMAAWTPVDHDPCPPGVVQALERLKIRPIAMSRFGEDRLKKEGFHDTLYVPHGVDTGAYRPRPELRDAIRRGLGIGSDTFVIGMVANNKGSGPSRKSFSEVFHAFNLFVEQHPNSMLYVHSDVMGYDDGVNLLTLAARVGMPKGKIACVDQYEYATGSITAEKMSAIYSMMDVLACPSYGEGFGVPIVEAQACGTPVIVTDWTAMSELCGAGWKVQGDLFDDPAHLSSFMRPSIFEIYEAMEAAYAERGKPELREQAAEFAQEYDADHVMDTYWAPVLEQLDPQKQRQVPAVKLNREQRRKLAKAS